MNLRRSPLLALAGGALIASAALTGCGSSDSADSRPVLAASFGPLAWAAEQVAGQDYRVVNLTSPGVEAHDIELGIPAMTDIEQADVVVLLSGFQPAVDRAAESVAEGTVLDVAEAAMLVPPDEHEAEAPADDHPDDHAEEHDHAEHDHGTETGDGALTGHEGHDHGEEDPHFWQDPIRMASVVDALAGELGRLHPDQADTYTARAAETRTRLTALDEEFRTGLAECERDTVVVSHEAFGYLTKYGLHFEAINGLSPGAEPTPADLARLQDLIRTEGITTVFSEARATGKLADTLAGDTGVSTAVLDPLESVPAGAEGDYFTIMRANLDALRKANACH